MIHCRWPSENSRSACAAGSAMFTTVASSTTMSCARATVARVHQRREGGAVDGRITMTQLEAPAGVDAGATATPTAPGAPAPAARLGRRLDHTRAPEIL